MKIIIVSLLLAVTVSIQEQSPKVVDVGEAVKDIAVLLKDEWGTLPDCEANPTDAKCETWGMLLYKLVEADREASRQRELCVQLGYDCGRLPTQTRAAWRTRAQRTRSDIKVALDKWVPQLTRNREAVRARLADIEFTLGTGRS